MKNKVLCLLLLCPILTACALPAPKTPIPSALASFPTDLPAGTDTPVPATRTPAPTPSVTPTTTPDYSLVGLPAEPAGADVFDFVDRMCAARWSSSDQSQPCLPEPQTQAQAGSVGQPDGGFVMRLAGEDQGFPSNWSLLLTFPPVHYFGTLSGTYPVFTFKDGDRFRAVLACRAHTFCDVEFGLEYYDAAGRTGLRHWQYLFADPPLIVDYPLGGLAGRSVQLTLTVTARGNPTDANAVWIAPHIYRPIPAS